MKKKPECCERAQPLTPAEMRNIRGGGIIDTMKCIAGTLSKDAGAVKTVLLGGTIFGIARMAGIMTGCSM